MSRSPGVSPFVAALLLAASVTVADEAPRYATAEEAVAARAWEEAARIWRDAAKAGRAEAYMGLGNLWDLGVLGERDRGKALSYYRQAADAGLAAGAFNVAAMYATGSGTGRDLKAAARWYAKAALAGHDRAAFALGRLYAEGKVLPRNARIAAGWLSQAAASVPAAQDTLDDLDPQESGALNAPVPLLFEVVSQGGQRHVQVAWSARPGPEDALFRVEVMEAGPNGHPGRELANVQTRGGAVVIPLPDGAGEPVWRVMMVDDQGADYAASGWIDPNLRPTAKTLARTVHVQAGGRTDHARSAAARMVDGLRNAGLTVVFGTDPEPLPASVVRYRFGADEALARDIARFLPALGAANVRRDLSLRTAPGEIVVSLTFDGGPAKVQSDN